MPALDWDIGLPSCSYPTSSLRDEPFLRPPPDAPRYDPYESLVPEPPRPTLDPIFDCYREPFPQEVAPGVRQDGALTAKHPLVDSFIAVLPHTGPREGRRPPREAWWTKRIRGLTANDILDLDLSDLHSECIFVLAALKLLYHFHHPAHFTLWSREESPRTARRVQKLLYMNPSPIASPVGWAGVQEQLWLINGIQKSIFENNGDLENGETINGMTLRKRKSRADGSGERRKRTRTETGETSEKENARSIVDSSTEIVLHNAAQLTIGDDAASVLAAPDPTRRSARQAHMRTMTTTPDVDVEAQPSSPPAARRVISRARSSSSAASSSATIVSENGSGSGVDTCVEPEGEGEEGGEDTARKDVKRTRGGSKEKEKETQDEEMKVRASTRTRKLAPKMAESVAQELEEKERERAREEQADREGDVTLKAEKAESPVSEPLTNSTTKVSGSKKSRSKTRRV